MHSVVLLRKLRNTDTETAQLLSGRGKVRPAGLTSPANSQYPPKHCQNLSPPRHSPRQCRGQGPVASTHLSVSVPSSLCCQSHQPTKLLTPFLSLDSSADSNAAWAPDLHLRKQDPERSAPRIAPVGLNLLQLQDCLGLLRASCSPAILPSSQHSSCSTKAFPSSFWNPHHSKEPAPAPSLCALTHPTQTSVAVRHSLAYDL